MDVDPRKAPRLEDRLGPLEPPYKSRGEAQVGRLLDRYGIPFFYEQPTVVLDRGRHKVWRPDFTLPDYNGLVVEYAGMPDVPDYMDGIRHKQQTYAANGITAVFIYPQDLCGPCWPAEVVEKIVEAAGTPARGSSNRSCRYSQDQHLINSRNNGTNNRRATTNNGVTAKASDETKPADAAPMGPDRELATLIHTDWL